jgi:hypothetical protein
MLEVKKTNDGIVLSLSFKLDMEDAADLALDIQQYINQSIKKMEDKNDYVDIPDLFLNRPTFKGIKESSIDWKAYDEAKAQNESKNKLAEKMRRMFVDVLDTEYLETKFATTYKLDELNREIEITRKKLNELKNK